MNNDRRAGVLLPVFSLPGRWGIGSFSGEAERFVAQLAEAEQSIWQVLPMGPTGYGDSPYQSFSTFAGNPYFIDLDALVEADLLREGELADLAWGTDECRIDYATLYTSRNRALRLAYSRSSGWHTDPGYLRFAEDASDWLDDYALFMTIKADQAGRAWTGWPSALRSRDPAALAGVRDRCATELDYHRWTQWQFTNQWTRLHELAAGYRVSILGDLPIYVALDSADTWANPELFDLDADLAPRAVAGVPPDGFSDTGQLWGNPLYDWARHRADGYAWWVRRLRHQLRNVDILRLDHFRGIESYYAVAADETDARNGRWHPGPGLEFFEALRSALGGELPLVAEDLGYLTDAVWQLRDATGLPGMQLIQFAFDSREPADYWPHNFVRNCVVYTGTHDNDTLAGWYPTMSASDRARATSYLHNAWTPAEELPWDFITEAQRSVANTCIVPMADYLGLGSEARINTPGLTTSCWSWRMRADAFTPALVQRIGELTRLVERDRR